MCQDIDPHKPTETDKGLEKFTEEMRLKLHLCQSEKGDEWKTKTVPELETDLVEEIHNWNKEETPLKKAHEVVDIANVCMMLYHRYIDQANINMAEKMGG